MPIETRCPACKKAYRLKDEFLGKKVKCPNAECQKPFVVEPVPAEPAPKPKAAPAPKKTAADLEREAEELASTMFGESAAPVVDTSKPVAMVCVSCDCKWEVTSDKRGKNVICPECGHRQKVPELKVEKKADWRDPNANRPSMARDANEVPDDLREQMTRQASGRALEEAGVIKEEIEPLPLSVKLQRAFVVLGVVAAVAFGVMYVLKSRQEGKDQKFMDDAVAEVEKISDDGMTKGQASLVKAVLLMAAAEHALRNDAADQRKLAVDRFSTARQLVLDQPRTPERDAVLGELAVLITKYGGDEEQIGKEFRLRWQPGGTGRGAQLNAGPADVQTELKRCLIPLGGAEPESRLSVNRRVVRELAKTGRAEVMVEIMGQGIQPGEVPETAAQIGLTLHREGNAAGAKTFAEREVLPLMAVTPSYSAQVLCEVAGLPLKPEQKLFSVPPSGQLSFGNRMYGAMLGAVNKDAATAVAVASREGQTDDKLRALAAAADWLDNPADAVAKADAILTGEGRGKSGAGASLSRLAVAAGRSGNGDAADRLTAGIADDGLRAWTKAEVIRAKLEAGKGQKADTAQLEPQTEKLKLRAGHAWATVGVARHNAATTGDPSAVREYNGWLESTFKAAGLAGLALGIQDRKK